MTSEPWQKYEVPGPVKAFIIAKPEMVSALIKRSKNPIFIAGYKSVETDLGGKKPIDYVIRIAKAANIPVVATAHTTTEFLDRNFKPTASMTSMDIGTRLVDKEWSVSQKQGPHDLALIIGLPYYMGFVIESGLKSYSFRYLKTISLDRHYQPHCNWSFSNLSTKDWEKNLELIAQGVEKK